MIETMTEQELLENRKDVPKWQKSKSMNPDDYKRLEGKRFEIELEQIENQYSKESYYDALL